MVSSVRIHVKDLPAKSVEIRRDILGMCFRAKSGHLGSSFSTVDILTSLYFHYLNIDPKQPAMKRRDRFILSKGHGCSALYVTLAHAGFFPKSELETFIQDGSRLPGHPSSALLPGVEASTGSLGHGLNIGVGLALAAKRSKETWRTVVVISDGECDEGSTWEAILTAGFWQLSGLRCIVDYNKIQSFGRVADVMELEPFADKWRAFGWNVQEVDGHDHTAILTALQATDTVSDKPSVIIAHTVKGKGVSYMENTVDWHYWSPNADHVKQGLSELQ